MKKLLIIQNYNINKGDISVIQAMKSSLMAKHPGLKIFLTSYDPQKARNEQNLESAGWLVNSRNVKIAKGGASKIIRMLFECVWVFYSLLWVLCHKIRIDLPLPKSRRSTIAFYLASDVVVLPGGHFFTTLNKFAINFSHFYGLLFAKLLDKKTMIYSQTIGPFNGVMGCFAKWMAFALFKTTDIITVRDQSSLVYLPKDNRNFLTAESVFLTGTNSEMVKSIPEFQALRLNSTLLVGSTIHHIYFKYSYSEDQYVQLMAHIYDSIISDHSFDVLIIPMEASVNGEGDRKIIKKIIASMKNYNKIHMLQTDYDSDIVSAIIASTDIFIGTKTHSIVYGLKSGVPTISISYHEKANEIMRMFNVEENAINLSKLSLEKFRAIFNRVVDNRERIKSIEHEAFTNVKAKAEENNNLLMNLFDS